MFPTQRISSCKPKKYNNLLLDLNDLLRLRKFPRKFRVYFKADWIWMIWIKQLLLFNFGKKILGDYIFETNRICHCHNELYENSKPHKVWVIKIRIKKFCDPFFDVSRRPFLDLFGNIWKSILWLNRCAQADSQNRCENTTLQNCAWLKKFIFFLI